MSDNLQVGLRISEERNTEMEKRAAKMGVTKNALILICVELGLKVLDSTAVITLRPQE